MKKIFLVKLYIRWNDDKDSGTWREKATPIWACESWEQAVNDVLKYIKESGDCSSYKKLYYIQDIELYK